MMFDELAEMEQEAKLISSRLRYEKYKQELEDVKRVCELLYTDYVRNAKSYKSIYSVMAESMRKSRFQIHEKLKKDRPDFEQIKGMIEKDFFNGDKIKIVNILSGGYESYYYQFDCKYKGYIFEIVIPNTYEINTDNFDYAYRNQFVVRVAQSDSYSSVIKMSYSIEDIASAIKNYISEV